MATPEAKPKKTRRKIGYQVQILLGEPEHGWCQFKQPEDTLQKAIKLGKESAGEGAQFQIVRIVAGPFTKRTQTQTKVVLE